MQKLLAIHKNFAATMVFKILLELNLLEITKIYYLQDIVLTLKNGLFCEDVQLGLNLISEANNILFVVSENAFIYIETWVTSSIYFQNISLTQKQKSNLIDAALTSLAKVDSIELEYKDKIFLENIDSTEIIRKIKNKFKYD